LADFQSSQLRLEPHAARASLAMIEGVYTGTGQDTK